MNREIQLTDEQFRRLPYKNTERNKDDTVGDVIGLLRRHGIRKYMVDDELEVISFPLRVQMKDMEREFTVKMFVSHLMYLKATTGGRYAPKTNVYLEKESWRMVWWYLKSLLEAIEFGLTDDLRAFTPYIYNKLMRDGPEVNLADAIIENAEQLTKLKQLPSEIDRPRVIETQFEVKES